MTAVFIEVNIAFYELSCEGFPGSINVIHKGNEVEDILSYCSKPYEIFPSFKGKALLTDELTENEEIGLESEDIVLDEIAKWFAEVLKLSLNENVLGPVSPPVARIRNEFISNILVKIPKEHSLQKTKAFIQKALQRFNAVKEFSRVKLTIDVDNY